MFGKPLSLLTSADVDRLWKEQVRESDVVEFKEALSGKGGRDAWHMGADKIGDAARDKLVNEVIAFANAHGGTLMLGIAETHDKPPRAEKIAPIERCADLAERLSRALADTVEPPLAPFPAIVPVVTEGDSGVVVFQVAASRNAPHRHRSTLQSHVRRGEQAVPMTMREIQDLTLQVERGLALLERQFAESAERFADICRPSTVLALRATAIPLTPLSVQVPNDRTISPTFRQFDGVVGSRNVQVVLPHAPNNFRPVLRGIRASDSYDGTTVTVEVKATGSLEVFFVKRTADTPILYAGWLAGMACNVLSTIDYLRKTAGAPGTEYGLEFAVFAPKTLAVGTYGGPEYGSSSWDMGALTFPRYAVGDRTQFADVVELVDRDFWNATGTRGTEPLRIEF